MSLVILRDGATLVLDATPTLSRTHAVSVTENPVEAGADVTDHAQVLPPRFAVGGVLSYEGPLTGASPALTGRARIDAGLAFLEASLGREVTLVYRGRTWESVLIEELVIPEEGGSASQPQISLRQVRIVSSQTTRLPRQVRRTRPSLQEPTPTGVQPTPPVTAAEAARTDKSLLAAGADTGTGEKVLDFFGYGDLSRRTP